MQNQSAHSATIPARIGRFQVRSLLGTGGFGSVYRAHDPLLGREVALKVAHPGLVENPAQRERFLREGRAAAELRHPHLVAVYDAGCEDGTYYMAAAYIEGRTLAKARKQNELDLRQSVEVVRQLAEALAYAHRQGIVHRDVKPANVLLDGRNQAHLTDFGIAHQQGSAEKLTHDGAILGTPAYMAPEQAAGRQGDPLPASDQYSLGAVLYELLTGQPPFSGAPVAILHGVLHQEPPAPRKLNAALPRDLERVCLKALAKRPEDRYADCRAFADDLRRWLEGEPVKARPLGLPERIWRWSKREPKLAAAGAVAALSLLAAALVPLLSYFLLARAVAENEAQTAELTRKTGEAETERQKADKAKEDANAEQQAAKKAEAQLKGETTKANDAKATAERVAKQAKEAEQRSLASSRALPRFQYVADIQLAQYALEAGYEQSLRRNLENPAGAGKPDLRGFEWRHLLPANHPLPISLPKPEGQLALVTCLNNRWLLQASKVREMNKFGLRVTLWDLTQRKEKGHATLNNCDYLLDPLGALSPTGLRMLQGNDTKQLKIRSFAEGGREIILKGHSRSAAAASFSHDGLQLATLHWDDALRVWDVVLKEPLNWKLPGNKLNGLAQSPDGKTLATAVGSETTLWDANNGTKRATLRGDGNAIPRRSERTPIYFLEFSPDNKLLAMAGTGAVTVWDVDGGQLRATLPTPARETVSGLLFSPDSKSLLTRREGNKKEVLTLWGVHEGKNRGELTPGVLGRCGAAFSPDGKTLAVLDTPGSVLLWDAATGERRLSVRLSRAGATALAFAPDGKELLVLFDDGKGEVWPAPLLERATTLGKPGARVESLAFAPKGDLAVAAGDAVTWWQLSKGQPGTTLPRPAGATVWAVSTDGGSVAAATKESVFLGHPGDKALAAFSQGGEARCLAFSRDGKLLAAGLATGAVHVWETLTKKPRLTGKGHKTAVRALAFTADGGRLATADAGQVLLWDLASGQSSPLPVTKVVALCFAPDGKTLCTGDEGGTVALWDPEGKKERATMKGAHRGGVHTVACSTDGRTFASGGEDGAVRLWEAVTGGELLTFAGKSQGVTALAFAADDTALAAGHANGDVRLWYALPEAGDKVTR